MRGKQIDQLQEFVRTQSFREYNTLQKLTQPLKEQFGITTFWHYRIDDQGSFSYTGNDPDAMYGYLDLDLHLSNPFFSHPSFFSEVGILEDALPDTNYQQIRNKLQDKTNLQNQYIVLRKPTPAVCEGFGFAAKSKNNSIDALVMQSREVLDSFIEYYLENSEKIRNKLYESRISVLEVRKNAFLQKAPIHRRLALLQEKRTLFLSSITSEKEALIEQLTKREKECVVCYLQGMTAEQTGRALFISNRTVETHFVHIKQKLNLESKRDLCPFARYFLAIPYSKTTVLKS